MAGAPGFFDEHWDQSLQHSEDDSVSRHNNLSSPSSTRSNPLSIQLPLYPAALEAASAALHYLPMPVLLLGPLKTVILANEAMGRLLSNDSASSNPNAVREGLMGQTLAQVGVDLIQRGLPIWLDWDVCHRSIIPSSCDIDYICRIS